MNREQVLQLTTTMSLSPSKFFIQIEKGKRIEISIQSCIKTENASKPHRAADCVLPKLILFYHVFVS